MKKIFPLLLITLSLGIGLAGCIYDSAEDRPVSEIKIVAEKEVIEAKETITLKAKIVPENSNSLIRWSVLRGDSFIKLLPNTGKEIKLAGKNFTANDEVVKIRVNAGNASDILEMTILKDPSAKPDSPLTPEGEGTGPDINVEAGKKVLTYGWADQGLGMTYPQVSKYILIDDETFADPVNKREAFTNAIASGKLDVSEISDTPAIIVISGEIDLSDLKISDIDKSYFDAFDEEGNRVHEDIVFDIGSNKTIIGVDGAVLKFGGLRIRADVTNSAKNIIIRNVKFYDAHGSVEKTGDKATCDNLLIEATGASNYEYSNIPQNIWIDHCEFSDGICSDLTDNVNHDGALDIKGGKNITISYCKFSNHDKVTLIGASDEYVKTEDRQITFHHNYYTGTNQRMPKARGSEVHFYNNYYESARQYCLGPGIGSQWIVENCYFDSSISYIVKYHDYSVYDPISDPDSPAPETISFICYQGNTPELSDETTTKESFTKQEWAPEGLVLTCHSITEDLMRTNVWWPQYSYKDNMTESNTLNETIPLAAGTDKEKFSKNIRVIGDNF